MDTMLQSRELALEDNYFAVVSTRWNQHLRRQLVQRLRLRIDNRIEELIDRGAETFLIETSQELLQTKAAVNGCKQAIVKRGVRLTVANQGTQLVASTTFLLRVDGINVNGAILASDGSSSAL